MRLGYTHEAAAFMRWVMARCSELEPDGSLQIMYGLDGRHALPEETLPHLEGYMGSSPVRIGNAAFDNLQLDIYGELMDSVYLYDKYGSPMGYDAWTNLVRLMDWLSANWHRPDEGIWEVRGGRQEFVFSRMMCWVAFDRAIRLATSARFRLRSRSGTRRGTGSSTTCSPGSGTRGVGRSSSMSAPPPSTRRRSSCHWSVSYPRPTRAGSRRCAIEHELVSDSLPLSPRRWILRRAHRRGGHVLDVLLLVRRVPLPYGRPAAGAVLLREDARLRQSPGAVRRGARPPGAASRQLPAGVYPPGAHQRRLRSRPSTVGRRPRRVSDSPVQ